ncbi:MAG: hypothetical protein ACOCWS_04920 [Alkalispirochaetaceae bacterium]
MPGKRNVDRGEGAREVTLLVDGKAVEINGFVADVFQEVAVALVRSLGTEKPSGRIELSISEGVD